VPVLVRGVFNTKREWNRAGHGMMNMIAVSRMAAKARSARSKTPAQAPAARLQEPSVGRGRKVLYIQIIIVLHVSTGE
jgi:hypothetical protein